MRHARLPRAAHRRARREWDGNGLLYRIEVGVMLGNGDGDQLIAKHWHSSTVPPVSSTPLAPRFPDDGLVGRICVVVAHNPSLSLELRESQDWSPARPNVDSEFR